MKNLKKVIALMLAAVLMVALCACGCSNDSKETLIESTITGSEVQEEFWNTNLDASAVKLAGYRAQSVEEVVANWRQAKMQGNGAILYALYSADLKPMFINRMKEDFGSWNFYYGKEAEKPLDVFISTPEAVDADGINGMYFATVTSILNDGTTSNYDIYIELVDGGYFVTSEQHPDVTEG